MRPRERVCCRVRVTLESPFLMRGIEGSDFGVDAAQLRDASGRALIPGDQVRGVLRQAVRELAAADAAPALDERDLFGRAPKEATGQVDEARGHLVVGDLAADCPPTGEVLPRVALDAGTGSARRGHLQMVELVAPIGAEVTFTGSLLLFAPAGSGAAIVDALRLALAMVPAIGAHKTVGFGRVVRTELTMPSAPVAMTPPQAAASPGGRFVWSFGVDRPLLVSSRRVEANVLAGAEVIPGGVLKGALARRLTLGGVDIAAAPWVDLLSDLHVGHAFPVKDGLERGRALPLSIATNRAGDALRDELLEADARLLEGEVPAFRPDWKGDTAETEVRRRLGIGGGLDQIMRTRTAIEPERGAAAEGSLFSFKMIDPAGVRWQAVVDTADIAAAELGSVLSLLEAGLDGIGKTDASMLAPALDPAPPPQGIAPVPHHPDHYAIMLETPALIIDTPALENGQMLHRAFADYFEEASGGTLSLVRFFASQSWAGGIVALRRKPYRPFVLVDAGACFLLQGDPDRLRDWLRFGLPQPAWAVAEGLDWRACVYLRENGFGAISLDRARAIRGGGA